MLGREKISPQGVMRGHLNKGPRGMDRCCPDGEEAGGWTGNGVGEVQLLIRWVEGACRTPRVRARGRAGDTRGRREGAGRRPGCPAGKGRRRRPAKTVFRPLYPLGTTSSSSYPGQTWVGALTGGSPTHRGLGFCKSFSSVCAHSTLPPASQPLVLEARWGRFLLGVPDPRAGGLRVGSLLLPGPALQSLGRHRSVDR